MMWSLLVPICLLLLVKKLWHWYNISLSDSNFPAPLPGGQFGWPIIGEIFNVFYEGPSFYERRFAECGRLFKTHLFLNPTIRVYGSDNIAKILQGENDIVTSRWPAATRLLFGKHTLAMAQGEDHAFMRKRVFTAFTHSALSGYVPMIQEPVRRAIESWCKSDRVLASEVLRQLSLRVAFDVLCGFRYGDTDVTILCEKFDDIISGIMTLPFNLPFSKFRKALKARDYLQSELHENLLRKAALSPEEDTPDAMRLLMDLAHKTGKNTSYEAIKNQVIEFLLGGIFSLSSAAATMLHELAKNPDVLTKVRHELSDNDLFVDGSPLTLEKVSQCRYVNQVVKECLRITPPVGAAFRTALKTFELDGKRIPKGWTVMWSVRDTIHLSESFTDTNKFDPERFSPERQEDRKGGRFCMPVFGGGQRSCIGQNFALLTLRIFLIELARMCDFQIPNADSIKFTWMPSCQPIGGMPTQFRRIQDLDENDNSCWLGRMDANCSQKDVHSPLPDGVTQRSATCQAA